MSSYFSPLDTDILETSQKFLYDWLVTSGKRSTVEALQKGELRISTFSDNIKARIAISSGNRIELLNATTTYLQGRIPQIFDRGALPDGTNIAISHIRLAYGSDAALLPEAIVNYTTVPSGWPAALQHADLMFSQNDFLKEKVAARACGSAAASFLPGVEGDGLQLKTPFILEESKSTKIELYCPQSVVFPATPAVLSVIVEFSGAIIKSRA